ncbi:hypothetical protein VTK26DRAFT_4897 [Humicola hyalothermophila]
MDAGEYETNTLVISNLSAVSYRIYEPIASQSSPYTFAASNVEDAFCSDGHLVYMDAVRHGIWCFYLSSGDPTVPQAEQLGLHARMEVCGYPLGVVKDGYLRPTDLVKNRPPGTNTINTPSSSSSTGSAADLNVRSSQTAGVPTMVDGKAAPTPHAESKYGSVPPREVHELFITAVLSSLTASFCRATGAILLNRRTVLLPAAAFNSGDADWNQPARTSALATFRTYLTTTGSLVISLHVSLLQGLVCSADVLRSNLLSASPTVLAAPFGAFGTLQGVVDTDGQGADSGFGQSPDTQVSRPRPDHSERFVQWKSICCQWLQMRGMTPSLLDGCSWLNIHFFPRKPYEQKPDGKRTPLANSGPTAPWPAPLCFRKPRLGAALDMAFENSLSATSAESIDPLSKAKEWCQGVLERENTLIRRKKERDGALAREQVGGDARSLHQPNGHSPVGPWRPAANGPLPGTGTIYPTPPDGVQPSGVTPSFESAPMRSPAGQALSANSVADIQAAAQQDVPAAEGFGVGWDGVEPRPEQSNNFSEENIFGDLGENMFEGNELTDADFNFFDEQPGAVDLDMPMLSDTGSTTVEMQRNDNVQPEEYAQTATRAENHKADARTSSPQFTKPELKHARSSMAEEGRQQTNMENFNLNSATGIKRHPSPFNPETIYKRIRASIRLPDPQPRARRGFPPRRRSMFEKVDFDPALSLASKKYEESGPFGYRSSASKTVQDRGNKTAENGGPLTTGRPQSSARLRRNLKELPAGIGTMLTKMMVAGASGGTISDSEDSSGVSDDDDVSNPPGRGSSPAKSSGLRRRPDDDVISMAASFKELDNVSVDSPSYGPPDLSRLSIMEIPDFSLTKYFAEPEQMPVRLSVSDEDFVAIAQLVTEQAASGSLMLAPQLPGLDGQDARRSLAKAIRYSSKGLQKALPRSLAGAAAYQLRPFAEVQDVPLIVQPHGRLQMRPAEFPRPSIFPIPVPHVEVRRYDNQLSVLPSAVSFWEALGLGPVQGPKDIVSLCMFPRAEAMRDNASAFLDRVQSTYESLRLGVFERLPTVGNIVNGLVLLAADQDLVSPGLNLARTGSAFVGQMANLAMTLANTPVVGKNFVVYLAYEPENPVSIVDACAAFRELVEHYGRCMADKRKPIHNAVVLQLVALDLVASETSLVAPSPSECSRICFETYDRCTLFGGPTPSPAIMLEKALPRGIEFKLTATPSPDILRENSCIHVAYARSVDERWVTAAWTDNRGSNQTMASYCLGRRGRPLSRRLGEALHEIWETTQELISNCKVHWRVIITRCGPMDVQEVEFWTSMAQAETRASISLVLLTVDTDPSLQLIPPAPAIPLSAPSAFYTTPVSTPQPPSVVSPDQSWNNPSTPAVGAATPGGDGSNPPSSQQHPHHASSQQPPPPPPPQQQQQQNELPDADTTLIDTSETTWGIVISHRLNNSPSLTDLNPALASGYLVKRSAGPSPAGSTAPPVIHFPPPPRGGGPSTAVGAGAEETNNNNNNNNNPILSTTNKDYHPNVNVCVPPPAVMEVNVVYSDSARVVYDGLLREMLTYFRGLGTLARARGVVDRDDVRPWHVAAAEKGVRALGLLM